MQHFRKTECIEKNQKLCFFRIRVVPDQGLTALSIEVSAGEVLASTFRASLCNITDFYHYAMIPLKNFYTPLNGAPQKCFK